MNRLAKSTRSKPTLVESLKLECDRFVALAFYTADVLIEADSNCKVTYAVGNADGAQL